MIAHFIVNYVKGPWRVRFYCISRIPSHLFVNCYVAYHRVPYQGHACMLCIQHQSLISLSLMISITTYMRMIHKFLSFSLLNLNKTLCLVKSKLEACVKHIDSWMVLNRLKLNQDKTELLLISSRYRQSLALTHLQVGEEKICPSESVRNLGVHFDQHARMHVHMKKVCQTSLYHLRNISKIRKYLSQETTEILIHAYITSKLDNCNSLLYGLPTYMINKLQIIQNAAARILTFTKKTNHITPILCKLHWLPVQYRIVFKILLLVYKGLNGLAPTYISELLHYRTSSRLLRSASQRLLSIPRTSLKDIW